MQKRWSDQEILDAIQAWADKYGRPPTYSEWMTASPEHPAAYTVSSRCGGWVTALEMLGFERNLGGRYAEERELSDEERARKLRKKGLSNREIIEQTGISQYRLRRMLGPRPVERKPQTAAERREARIAALRKALERQGE